MYEPIFGSKGRQIGYRHAMEVFNMRCEKIFDVDIVGRLIDPHTNKIVAWLQPVDSCLPQNESLDHLF